MSNDSAVTRVIFETIFVQSARAQGATTEQAIELADAVMTRVRDSVVTLERTMALIEEIEERAREMAGAPEDPAPRLRP